MVAPCLGHKSQPRTQPSKATWSSTTLYRQLDGLCACTMYPRQHWTAPAIKPCFWREAHTPVSDSSSRAGLGWAACPCELTNYCIHAVGWMQFIAFVEIVHAAAGGLSSVGSKSVLHSIQVHTITATEARGNSTSACQSQLPDVPCLLWSLRAG